jgi:transcriptional regulator with XRE-family HTH domain
MDEHGHQQKDVIKATGLTQPQVSKVLSGERRRITTTVRAICQYAGFDVDAAYAPDAEGLPLSQSARRLLEDNPAAAAVVARIVDVLLPALLNPPGAVPPPIAKETP